MKKIDKKRGAIYSVVALMMCTAVYLNWSYTADTNDQIVSKNYGETKLVDNIDDDQVTSVVGGSNSFDNARLTRQKSRDEAISMLTESINNENTPDEAKVTASASVEVLSKNVISEAAIETMISAKGYVESVVFISDDGVNVLVSSGDAEFSASDAAVIRDIVISETSISADKIKIIESN